MIHKPIDEITAADIQALIDSEVMESRTIEYKRDLPGGSEKDKVEFLADVTAFANAGGGDLVFGITEENGKPVAATGLDMANLDAEILRLESLLRNGVDPRIPAVQMKVVTGCEKNPVLVIHVPNSWSSPHMITLKGSQKFYVRNNGRRDKMDVTEIRSAFALSDSIPEKIRRFRDDRLAKVISGNTPVRLRGESKIVLHIIPLMSLATDFVLSPSELKEQGKRFRTLRRRSSDPRFNLDGMITAHDRDEKSDAYREYCQVFRRGMIEAVSGKFVHEIDGCKGIHGVTFEEDLIEAIEEYIKALRGLKVAVPYIILLSMAGMSECTIFTEPSWGIRTFDRDMLILPDVLVENCGVGIALVLRPVFDSVWNAVGVEGSRNYTEEGCWKPHMPYVPYSY